MKKMTKMAVLAVLALALSTASVWATCSPAKVMTQFSSSKGLYTYTDWDDNLGTQNTDLVGRYWKTGAYATANSDDPDGLICTAGPTCWFRQYAATGRWYVNSNLGAGGVGCPSINISAEMYNQKTGEFFAYTLCESGEPGCPSPAGYPAFDVADVFDFDFAPTVIRPRAVSSSRAGTTVNVTLAMNPVYYQQFTTTGATVPPPEARVYRAISATKPSPNIATGAWVQVGTLPVAGGQAAFAADCASTATDNWFAVGVVVAGEAPRFVSAPTQVECDPNLADPNGRFRMIDKTDGTKDRPSKDTSRERR